MECRNPLTGKNCCAVFCVPVKSVPVEKLEKLVTDIETELQNSMQREVTSETIGELALAALREVDEVAYVRFASVYRRFKDIDSFLEELEKLRDSHEN